LCKTGDQSYQTMKSMEQQVIADSSFSKWVACSWWITATRDQWITGFFVMSASFCFTILFSLLPSLSLWKIT
jgi:hypothetical protein